MSVLGVDRFERVREEQCQRIGDLKDKFCQRMREYLQSSETNTIFTDDLKTILHLADTDEDIETATQMMRRYHQQDSFRFSQFTFGPGVMRLCFLKKKPELAYQLFKEKELVGFFDQLSSFTVLMDLLFESGHYDKVLDVLKDVADRQVGGFKYPFDCVTLALASCLKMNSPASHQESLSILSNCKECGATVSPRSATYAAVLALKQNDPERALEIASLPKKAPPNRPPPIGENNIKALIYTTLNRLEDAMQILKFVLQNDRPEYIHKGNEIFPETVSAIEEAVEKTGNLEMKRQFEIVINGLGQGGHIRENDDFENYLFRPIMRRPKLQAGYKNQQRSSVGGVRRERGQQAYRPGLSDSAY